LYKNRIKFVACACSLLVGGILSSCDDEMQRAAPSDLALGQWFIEDEVYAGSDAAGILSSVVTETQVDMKISHNGLAVKYNTNGIPEGMTLGDAKQVVIRANGNWKIIPKLAEGDSCNYVTLLPPDGVGDSRIRMSVFPNYQLKPRSCDFALVVNGVEQPNIFLHIDQEAAPTYLNVGAPNISSQGGLTAVGVSANVPWVVEIDQTDWIEIDSVGATAFRLNVQPNMGLETRSVNIRVKAPEFPELDTEITVNQLPDGIYFLDDFDWLGAFLTSTASYCQDNLYKNASSQQHLLGSNKKGNDVLPQTNGWDILGYGWLYTAACSCYVGWHNATANHDGNGFLKIGRTSFFGDVTTPPLEAIEGTRDIKIRFKAASQTNTSNVKDGNILCIGVLRGNGQVKNANANITVGNYMDTKGTPGPAIPVSVMQLEVENLPTYNKNTAADVDLRDFTTYEVVITGADATTQISFIGGSSIGVDWVNGAQSNVANRIFIDDVQVLSVDREL
ncbi:MAG: BACON domain-containing protein, partial [Muribaculaceae bacterium]|nr:BACON domain-containing protein [Muribaculaceae bacterium]